MAGYAVGAILLFTAGIGLMLYLIRRAAKKAKKKEDSGTNDGETTWDKPEMDANNQAIAELGTSASPARLDSKTQIELQEMHTSEHQEDAISPELEGSPLGVEISGDNGASELNGDEICSE